MDLVTWGRSGKLTRLDPGEVSAEFWDVGRLDGASQDSMNEFFNRYLCATYEEQCDGASFLLINILLNFISHLPTAPIVI